MSANKVTGKTHSVTIIEEKTGQAKLSEPDKNNDMRVSTEVQQVRLYLFSKISV